MLAASVGVVVGSRSPRSRRRSGRSKRCATCSSPRALVIRDGERSGASPAARSCAGDLLVLSEGDRVPADAVLAASSYRPTSRCSPASRCRSARSPPDRGGAGAGRAGDDQPFGVLRHAGGRRAGARAVTATGPRSELGRIGTSLAGLEPRTDRARSARPGVSCACSVAAAASHSAWSSPSSTARSRGDWLGGAARRARARDGVAAGGVPGRAHGVPRARAPGASRATTC